MRYASAAAFRRALLDRLNHLAAQTGVSADYLRKRVVFERLAARLLVVAPGRWVLKGALALDLILPRPRATKDADFLGPADSGQVVEDLLAAQAVDLGDYFAFELRRVREIDPDSPEPSMRFHVTARLGGIRFDEAAVDVGIRGPGVWQPARATSKLLGFAGLPAVEIPVVPPEIQLAEKIHAYTRRYGQRQQASTRIKDLIDILRIVQSTVLDAATLTYVLRQTFERRKTHEMPGTFPAPPAAWAVPFRRLAERTGLDTDVRAAHREAAACLDPVLRGTAFGRWNPKARRWT